MMRVRIKRECASHIAALFNGRGTMLRGPTQSSKVNGRLVCRCFVCVVVALVAFVEMSVSSRCKKNQMRSEKD